MNEVNGNIKIMKTIEKAIIFLNTKTNKLCNDDRVILIKEAKTHILKIREIYMESKEIWLIKLIRSIIIKKREIEKDILKYQFPV